MTIPLLKGQIIKIAGLPFRLCGNVDAETDQENYKLFLSQEPHCVSNPLHAAGLASAETSNLSLGPICDHNESRI